MLGIDDVSKYICDKLIDMLETTPFHEIKITEFVKYAKIGRSTFYNYFDSLYDVLQRIEDDLLAELELKQAIEIFMAHMEEAENKSDGTESCFMPILVHYKKNRRTYSVLMGKNGDPYFEIRISQMILSLCRMATEELGPKYPENKQNLMYSYIAGGVASSLKWMATHMDDYDFDDFTDVLFLLSHSIMELLEPNC